MASSISLVDKEIRRQIVDRSDEDQLSLDLVSLGTIHRGYSKVTFEVGFLFHPVKWGRFVNNMKLLLFGGKCKVINNVRTTRYITLSAGASNVMTTIVTTIMHILI